MKTGERHNLEDLILEELKTGAKKMSRLVLVLAQERPGTTKQGVYAALRVLRAEEKVVVHGGFASLSNVWLERMIEYFSIAQQNYAAIGAHDNSFLNLAEGERVQYFFRDPVQTDAFWSHVYTILNNTVPAEKPIYLYNPHEWFMLVRRNNERETIKAIIDRGRAYFMTIGNKTVLDQALAKEFNDLKVGYRLLDAPLFKKQNYYLNIIGDFLIEVHLDQAIENKIDEFFKTTGEWTPKAQEELERVVGSRGRSKLTVSRNAKKASRLVTLLGGG
jgi:hypothetical protein